MSLCTYNVPHPSKHCINVRIQTKGAAAIDVLQQGLEDLSNICDHIMEVFQVPYMHSHYALLINVIFREKSVLKDFGQDV